MKSILLCLMLWKSGAAWAETNRPETIADTLDLLAQRYEQTGQFATVEIDLALQTVTATLANGEEFVSSGTNLHQVLQTAADDLARDAALDQFVAGLLENVATPQTEGVDLAHILPVVRHKDYGAQSAFALYSEPFVGDLRVYYALDLPNSISYLSPETVAGLGLDPIALRSRSMANFEPLQNQTRLQGDTIYMAIVDGNYELTLLLNPLLWDDLDRQIGRIVVIPAARDLLLFVDADIPGAVDGMKMFVADNWSNFSYTMSQDPITWRDGTWVPYE